ncbi:hypothetical protein CDES_10615 [Corynebacterium deserti GIMN1.010]|uniref:Uncharacterized protein n=1 Tax=Corynebacterium deserti GIMN1.010 TaxID=931089 RepID=A0A0M5IIX1_9CORY|nr:hypothetical protein [Corynebacterium deserti]ALC06498.1 hypothetical protein CDES_10615 [Corynebacterium deserti GIMN1.010]
MNDFDTTIDRITKEHDPTSRGRVEQFIVEIVRALPNLTTKQSASLAIQLLDALHMANKTEASKSMARNPRAPLDLPATFDGLTELISGLDVRSDSEWHSFGFKPREDAHPLLIAIPEIEIFYQHTDVEPTSDNAVAPNFWENQTMWRRRLGSVTEPNLIYKEFSGPGKAQRAVEMLGNLWKIGVVATKDTESRLGLTSLVYKPVAGEVPVPLMTEQNCWYHIRVSETLGENQVPEIVRCLAEVFCGYIPQVWLKEQIPAGKLRIQESEAAAYIALARLDLSPRTGNTTWTNSYMSTRPLSPAFRWDVVLEASHQVENLLRGDTGPVTAISLEGN